MRKNATVSQLFCLIIAYVLGEAMAGSYSLCNVPREDVCTLFYFVALIPTRGWFKYLNPGPFNIKEHAGIVIMSSTASTVAIAMEVIAALGMTFDHQRAMRLLIPSRPIL
jgi:OPT oligopeptide transporter protein